LLTGSIEKVGGSRKSNIGIPQSNINLIGKTLQKPIFAQSQPNKGLNNQIIEIQIDPELFHRFSNKMSDEKKDRQKDVMEDFVNNGNVELVGPKPVGTSSSASPSQLPNVSKNDIDNRASTTSIKGLASN
jgi:hypothetical protein